jgi:hypothetical protein
VAGFWLLRGHLTSIMKLVDGVNLRRRFAFLLGTIARRMTPCDASL